MNIRLTLGLSKSIEYDDYNSIAIVGGGVSLPELNSELSWCAEFSMAKKLESYCMLIRGN